MKLLQDINIDNNDIYVEDGFLKVRFPETSKATNAIKSLEVSENKNLVITLNEAVPTSADGNITQETQFEVALPITNNNFQENPTIYSGNNILFKADQLNNSNRYCLRDIGLQNMVNVSAKLIDAGSVDTDGFFTHKLSITFDNPDELTLINGIIQIADYSAMTDMSTDLNKPNGANGSILSNNFSTYSRLFMEKGKLYLFVNNLVRSQSGRYLDFYKEHTIKIKIDKMDVFHVGAIVDYCSTGLTTTDTQISYITVRSI